MHNEFIVAFPDDYAKREFPAGIPPGLRQEGVKTHNTHVIFIEPCWECCVPLVSLRGYPWTSGSWVS